MSACLGKAKPSESATGDFVRGARTSVKPTVLIVEDHDDTREMLCTLLSMWGCRVVEACNGLEAVEAASQERPALILMDGSLPFLDGLGATRRIRENGLGDQVKILALNGWGPKYHAAALAAGSDDCIEKPFDVDQLRRHLVPLFAFSSYAPKQTSNRIPG
ncbi:MAG TPA: response regulator [Pyrinomonadaceae bacterium]|jgi:CheY-like chemotaxis protein